MPKTEIIHQFSLPKERIQRLKLCLNELDNVPKIVHEREKKNLQEEESECILLE